MAAQETYQILETTTLVLRETGPSPRMVTKDIAVVRDQSERLLHLIYRDAERGFQYDYVTAKRYVVYLAPVGIPFLQDGKRIGEFSRLDMAEMVCDALNARITPTRDEEIRAFRAAHLAGDTQLAQELALKLVGFDKPADAAKVAVVAAGDGVTDDTAAVTKAMSATPGRFSDLMGQPKI